jgi:hypothetical protein
MQPYNYDLDLRQGDTWDLGFYFDRDVTSYGFKMTIVDARSRTKIKELLTNANFTITYSSITNKTTILPIISATDTKKFNFRTALYDLQVTVGEVIKTYFTGEITLIRDITVEK